MNIYDTANRLASEIKQSEEYVNYKMAKEALNLNRELKKKIGEFEMVRYEAQITQMQTGKEDEEKLNKMKQLYAELIEIEENKIYTLEDKKDEWSIKEEDGIFIVSGRAVQRLMGRVNIEDNESMYYLQKCLKNMGIDEKLKEMGVCEGDTVILDDWELEWYE